MRSPAILVVVGRVTFRVVLNSLVLTIVLQKPGKPKGPPKNLRPITLLNTIRMALSIITLHRIRPCTEEYLSHSQSGFRPDRSTADVAWAHKWLAAKTKKEDVEIKITGIDMSSAFDTIDRQTLLDILREIVEEDELLYSLTSQIRNIDKPDWNDISFLQINIYISHFDVNVI